MNFQQKLNELLCKVWKIQIEIEDLKLSDKITKIQNDIIELSVKDYSSAMEEGEVERAKSLLHEKGYTVFSPEQFSHFQSCLERLTRIETICENKLDNEK